MPGVKYGKRRSASKAADADDGLLPLARPKEEGLLPPDSSWSSIWRGMPAYEMGSTEAYQKVTIHFRDAEEVAEFGRLMGIDMTARTETVWFSQPEDYIAPKELIYTEDDRRPPRYPIYIPSVGRWDDPRTALALMAIGVPFRVVVEPAQFDNYAAALGAERLLVLPEDYSKSNTGSIPARNFIWEHALSEGHARHWVMDDNVRGFLRLHRNRRIPVNGPAIFRAAEDFTDRYENVAFSGFNYMYLAPDRGELPPFYLNTRVYSMILVNNAAPYRWRGRYNEDTDICLRALKDGWVTVLFNAFLGDKAPTLTMKGGNTDTVYATGDKRLEFAESLVAQHPDVAKVVWRYGRWHHEVNYAPFSMNKLIPRANPPVDGGDYGMRLIREKREGRYPTVPSLGVAIPTTAPAEGAVRLAPKKAVAAPAQAVAVPSPTPAVELPPTAPAVVLAPRRSRVATVEAVWPEAPQRQGVSDPFLAFHAATLATAGSSRIAFDSDWDFEDRSAVGCDVETFENFWLVCFKRFSTGKRIAFEKSARSELDSATLRRVVESALIVTFNGASYDLPMIFAALRGDSLPYLKAMSDKIIKTGIKPWDIEREFGVVVPSRPALDHVDLLEPNPSVRQGLKVLAGRLHARFLVDLPFDPDAILTPEQMNVTTLYCMNDVDATQLLFDALAEPYELRRALSNEHKIDMRSKSDAQIGEAIVKKKVEDDTGKRLGKPIVRPRTFRYAPPTFIRFDDERLDTILSMLRTADFYANPAGVVDPPEILRGLKIEIGDTTYSMGIGGLHSTEANRAVLADEEHWLEDVDVASQYPSIILKLGIYPEVTGPAFLSVYRSIVEERLHAKATKNKVKADGLKIAVNGVFGKLGSSYSPLFAPELMIAVTLTGQLSLLMLIERLTAAGAQVVSGNTDGVVIRYRKTDEVAVGKILASWEEETGFTVERARYKAIYNSSVNTYIAVKEDGKIKRKGPPADPWSEGDKRGMLSKNPQRTICSKAVVDFVTKGAAIAETVRACRDPRMLVTVIKVNTGGSWRGSPLGRVVRWYWSIDGDPIVYTKDGRKVANTDGAKPLMELTDEIPADVDWDRYVEEAMDLARDLGAIKEGIV